MSKSKNILIIISLVLSLFITISDMIPLNKVVEDNIWIQDKIQISAHRGGASLNPENTQKAFDYIIKETNYTDIIELDLRITKDNVIVINHDEDLNRLAMDSNQESIILSKYNYEELKEYNLGRNFVDLKGNKPYINYSILDAKNEGLILMTLEDFFIRYNEYRDFKLFIEIKDFDEKGRYIADLLMDMLNSYSWYKDRSMIISFDDNLMEYMDEKYKNQYIGSLGNSVIAQILLSKLKLDYLFNPKYESIQVPYNKKTKNIPFVKVYDQALIKTFKNRNQLVVYWGINTKEDMMLLIKNGTHVITTDRPDLLAEILGR